ncbi:hypothetical protein ANCCEY_11812 [Ancylostoma ceylanicum]|uniref:Uncharacterized protein n=1 Tax=Ancylostoma ceylanicum TaxID=53326 RepID=A0A0D6LB31_9BILA|nr:hypothetical protein ANCCEY_11812 [Ancylostoma ceylanicum]
MSEIFKRSVTLPYSDATISGFNRPGVPYYDYLKETVYALPRPPVYINKEIEVPPSPTVTLSAPTARPTQKVVKVTSTTEQPSFEEQVDEFGEVEETTVLATQRTTQPQFIFTTPSTTQMRHEVFTTPTTTTQAPIRTTQTTTTTPSTTTTIRQEFTIVPVAPVEPVQDVKDDYDDYTEVEAPGQETQVTQHEDHVVEVSVVPTQVTSTHIPTTSSGYTSTTTAPRTSFAAILGFETQTTTQFPSRPVTIPTVPPPEVQTFMATTTPPPTTQPAPQPQTTTPARPTTNRIIFSHGFAPQQPPAPAQPVQTQIIVAPATVARPNSIVLSNAVTPQTVLVPAQPVQVVQTQSVVPNLVQVAPVAPQVVVATARPSGVIHTGAVSGSIGKIGDQTFIATSQPAQIIHVQTVGQNAAGSSSQSSQTANGTVVTRTETVSLNAGQVSPQKTVLLTSQPSQLIHVQPVNDNVAVVPQTFISSGSQSGSIVSATAAPQIFFATAIPGQVSPTQTLTANVVGQVQVQEGQKPTGKTELASGGSASKSTTITVTETREEPEDGLDYGQSAADIMDTAVLGREIEVDTVPEEDAKKTSGNGYNRRESNANLGRKKASGIVQHVQDAAVDLMDDWQNSYRRFW